MEFEPENANEDRTKYLLKLGYFVWTHGPICFPETSLTICSASACAAIKTSKLPELTARADLTCKSWKPTLNLRSEIKILQGPATISTFGRRESSFSEIIWARLTYLSSTENFLLIVCGSVPTLKPLYDQVHQYAKSAFSSVSTRVSGKTYGSDSTQKRSYRVSPEPRIPGRSYRIGSRDQSFGISTKIDAGPAAKVDHWNHEDGHSLLEMGDITVKSGWEVTRERQGSGQVPIPHVPSRLAHVKPTIVTGDNMV